MRARSADAAPSASRAVFLPTLTCFSAAHAARSFATAHTRLTRLRGGKADTAPWAAAVAAVDFERSAAPALAIAPTSFGAFHVPSRAYALARLS
eukprot:6828713-Prymnesium_polylepis.1